MGWEQAIALSCCRLRLLLLLGALALAPGGPVPQVASRRRESVSRSSLRPLLKSLRATISTASSPELRSLAQLPFRFEPNQGQTDPRVKFLARGAATDCFLPPTRRCLTLAFASQEIRRAHAAGGRKPGRVVTGDDQLPGKSNYFIGNDPGKVASRYSAICPRALSEAFIPALTWCITATRDSWNMTSKWLRAPIRKPSPSVSRDRGKPKLDQPGRSDPGDQRRRGAAESAAHLSTGTVGSESWSPDGFVVRATARLVSRSGPMIAAGRW